MRLRHHSGARHWRTHSALGNRVSTALLAPILPLGMHLGCTARSDDLSPVQGATTASLDEDEVARVLAALDHHAVTRGVVGAERAAGSGHLVADDGENGRRN